MSHNAKPLDAVLEDLQFLAEHRVGLIEAARRMGFGSPNNLDKWLRRHGRADVIAALTRNDPCPLTNSRKAS